MITSMNERDQWLNAAMAAHETALLRMCFLYLGDLQLAEDAVQETFIKAYRRFDSYRGRSQEKTWLTAIAINTCKDMRRSAWFRHVDSAAALEQLPEQAAPYTEWDDTVTQAVMALEEKYRAVVLLYYYQELTAREISQALGITPQAVYKRLKKAYATLHKTLGGSYEYAQ